MKPHNFEQAWQGGDGEWLTIISDREGTLADKTFGRAIAVVYGKTKAEAEERAAVVFDALVKHSRRRKSKELKPNERAETE